MLFLYNLLINIYGLLLGFVSVFNPKARLMTEGRKDLLSRISASIKPGDSPVWFHAASLGEFEQGRPLIEAVKKARPDKKILLTFYSPSGYEVRKDYELADWVFYLPLDNRKKMQRFVDITDPSIAIFIKYEFWPNLIESLRKKKTETIVVSAIFREDQIFFKPYGGWMRRSLKKLSKIFVQDDNSVKLLSLIDIDNVSRSGDTRFDRVLDILKSDNTLSFVEDFKNNKKLFVSGSSWPDDDSLMLDWINNSKDIKIIIAPHNIDDKYIEKLRSLIKRSTILYSEINGNENIAEYEVLILDTVGILTKVYSYADVAYVGGGFGKEGIHNVLEPAVFAIPVIIGPVFHQFREAVELAETGGLRIINSSEEFAGAMSDFKKDKLTATGKSAFNYIEKNSGARKVILDYITKVL